MSAITLRARAREFLLPLVLFPTDDSGDPSDDPLHGNLMSAGELGDAWSWLRLLIGFDVIFFTVGVLIFDWVIES